MKWLCLQLRSSEVSDSVGQQERWQNPNGLQLKHTMFSPFCGQWVFTGKFSYSRMTPKVQSSPSFSLVSSFVCLSKSVFSVHSCRFCAVTLMFSLYCSDMTVLTADREETVTVALTSRCQTALKVLENRLIDLQWILRVMTADAKTTQIIPKPAATRWSRVHARAFFFSFAFLLSSPSFLSFTTKNNKTINLWCDLWQSYHISYFFIR